MRARVEPGTHVVLVKDTPWLPAGTVLRVVGPAERPGWEGVGDGWVDARSEDDPVAGVYTLCAEQYEVLS